MILKHLTLLASLALGAFMAPGALAACDCDQASQKFLLGLDDDILYDVGLAGITDLSGELKCKIHSSIGKSGFCDLYFKVGPFGVQMHACTQRY